MKIAIYSPYLDTLGGGERYILTIAEYLSKSHKITIFWNGDFKFDHKDFVAQVKQRFELDITKVHFEKNIMARGNIIEKYQVLKNFDRLFAVSDGSIPIGFAKRNILHFQVPFKIRHNLLNKIKLLNWKTVIVNSQFTKNIIDKSYGVNSKVLYPPVDITALKPLEKENIILSVGRFFSPLHDKKQEILIEAFKKLSKEKPSWKLILVGGAEIGTEKNLETLKKTIGNASIEIRPNIAFKKIKELYGKAKIYWHAAGFQEDENENPEKVEHFGISTVEAMASGCIPVVVPYGGQKEIVDDEVNGYYFLTTDEMLKKTKNLIDSRETMERFSQNAIKKSKNYSKEKFCQKINEIIS